jgi:uncharacterized membrane protein
MEAKAKLFGHSIHQMLIVFPLGLLGMGVIFDLIHFSTDDATFAAVAYWMMIAGLAGGALAAPFGLIDWIGIPAGTRAKAVGAAHGIGNVIVLSLFLISVVMRSKAITTPEAVAYACSFAGLVLALGTAWLGGELVTRFGIGVHADANVDAPPLHHAPR